MDPPNSNPEPSFHTNVRNPLSKIQSIAYMDTHGSIPLQMSLLKLTEINVNLSNLKESVTKLSIKTDEIEKDVHVLKSLSANHGNVLDVHASALECDRAHLSTSTEMSKLQRDGDTLSMTEAVPDVGTGFSDSNSLHDYDDDDELCYTSNSLSKLQFRKYCLKARWNEEMGMAEVVQVKGRTLTSTGIARNGKVYFSIEEALFLAQVGALILLNDDETPFSLASLFERIASGSYGCSWKSFEAYRHLKALGYIVGRHGVPWSLKSIKGNGDSLYPPSILDSDTILDREFEANSVTEPLNCMQINEARPLFDVYLPNSKFKKTDPGIPSFILCSTSGHPPTTLEIEAIERRSNGIPLKFCNVEHGRVSYFCFNKVDLPLLP